MKRSRKVTVLKMRPRKERTRQHLPQKITIKNNRVHPQNKNHKKREIKNYESGKSSVPKDLNKRTKQKFNK